MELNVQLAKTTLTEASELAHATLACQMAEVTAYATAFVMTYVTKGKFIQP